jgi:hypothetical protein
VTCEDCLGPIAGAWFVAFDPLPVIHDSESGELIQCGAEKLVCADCIGWYREGCELTEQEATENRLF